LDVFQNMPLSHVHTSLHLHTLTNRFRMFFDCNLIVIWDNTAAVALFLLVCKQELGSLKINDMYSCKYTIKSKQYLKLKT